MKKTKILTIFCVALVALNLILIATTLWHDGRPPGGPDEKRDIVIHELGLDEGQVKKYDELIHWHRSHVRQADQHIMGLKNQLYASLNQPQPDNRRNDSLIAEIGKVQLEIEHIHYQHFRDIRKLCRPDQMAAYDDMATHIAEIFSNRPRR